MELLYSPFLFWLVDSLCVGMRIGIKKSPLRPENALLKEFRTLFVRYLTHSQKTVARRVLAVLAKTDSPTGVELRHCLLAKRVHKVALNTVDKRLQKTDLGQKLLPAFVGKKARFHRYLVAT